MPQAPSKRWVVPFVLGSTALAQTQSFTVDELVDHALASNRGLIAFRQRLPAARGALRQAGLRVNPSVEVVSGNGAVLGNPGVWDVSAAYFHTFELGGKRDRRVVLAESEVAASGFELENQERFLRAEIRRAYLTASSADRNLANARDLQSVTEDSLRLISARVMAGESPALDLSLVQVEVNRIRTDIRIFEDQFARAKAQLRVLAGLPASGGFTLTSSLEQLPSIPSLDNALSLARERRPDLRTLRQAEKSTDAALQLEKAQAKPNLTGFARFGYEYDNFGIFGISGSSLVPIIDRDRILSVGIAIPLPVRNKNEGNIDMAIARGNEARSRRQYLDNLVEQEIRAAYSRVEAIREATRIFENGVLYSSVSNLRVVRGAYDMGELRLLDVVNEQRRLVETQRTYTELLRQHQEAIAEVESAIGVSLAEVKP